METAKTRHTIVGEHLKNIKQRAAKRLDQKELRRLTKRNSERAAYYINRVATKVSNKTKLLLEGKEAGGILTKLYRNPWAKKATLALGGLYAFNLVGNAFSRFSPEPAIPKEYERSYDLINEYTSDFGSPVKLSKTVNKTITPYYSSIRKANYTTTGAITNSNLALSSSKNAIKHHEY